MINTIIFDFGDVFIDLDKDASVREFKKLGLEEWNEELEELNIAFEKGQLSELKFIQAIQKHIPNASIDEVRFAWNAILGDFPLRRLEFLQMLSLNYRLFLLTNTDIIHIEKFQHKVGMSFARDFYQCFEKVYFSTEMKMRKPEEQIFNYIIKNHDLSPKRTLFVDDRIENIEVAASLGLNVWHLQKGKEDVTEIYDKNIL